MADNEINDEMREPTDAELRELEAMEAASDDEPLEEADEVDEGIEVDEAAAPAQEAAEIAEPDESDEDESDEDEEDEEDEPEDELDGDEIPETFKEITALVQAAAALPKTKKEAKPKRETILTPFELTKFLNQRLEAEGVLDLKTGLPKKVGSPMVYIYANKSKFKTHTATDGSGRMECDEESAFQWVEAYVADAKAKFQATVTQLRKQLAENAAKAS
jgi:nucleosome binding factor SPN SPT16 subunit